MQGLRANMNRLLEDETIGDRDRVFFTLGSNRLVNNYNGWGLRAGEWRRNAFRVETMLQHLARMLNSNEQFEVNDTFQLAFVHVRDGPRGGGRRRMKPDHRSLMVMRRMKETVVRIPRTHENTCCARAIVTARGQGGKSSEMAFVSARLPYSRVGSRSVTRVGGRASREMRGCGTQVFCGSPEHVRVYDRSGGCRPVLRNVCVRIWP